MSSLRIAIIGCGAIAHAYRTALAQLPELELAAVVDPNPLARDQLAAENNSIARCAELAELPAIDAALVLTPPSTHEAITLDLLQRGVHVLCEKPLAPSIDAARRMLAAAKTAKLRLMMGSKFRYTPDVTEARALLDDNVCGDVVMYENVFCSHVDMTQRWNAQPAISGGGVLIDNGCHSVDLARYLLGPLSRVQVQFGRRVQDLPVEDTARMLFQSASGALGSIDLSWSVHKQTDAYVRMHGTNGTLEIGWQGSRYKSNGSDWQAFGQGYDKVVAFGAQLQNFAACVRGKAEPVIGDTGAMASVVVIDRAYESARSERWVDIPS
ncbi:MAG: Gfo/Idh/MocA family protein [Planctomycetota bacterium]